MDTTLPVRSSVHCFYYDLNWHISLHMITLCPILHSSHVSVLLFQSVAWLAFANRNTLVIHMELCTFCSQIGGHHCKEAAGAFTRIKIVRVTARPKDIRKPSSVSRSAPDLQLGHGWASSHSPPPAACTSFALPLSGFKQPISHHLALCICASSRDCNFGGDL